MWPASRLKLRREVINGYSMEARCGTFLLHISMVLMGNSDFGFVGCMSAKFILRGSGFTDGVCAQNKCWAC